MKKKYFEASVSSGRFNSKSFRPSGEGLITLIANASPSNLSYLVESYISQNRKKITDDEIEAALDFYQIRYFISETKDKKIERLLNYLRFK